MKMYQPVSMLVLSAFFCLPLAGQPPERGEPARGEGRGRGRPEAVERYFTRLEEQNPEEAARLRELRQTDPQAFREEMRSRLHRKRGGPRMESLTEDTSIQELAANVRNADSEEAYLEAKQALRDAVGQRFDQTLAAREQALNQLRERLQHLEEKHQRETEKRDRIIERQLQRLLQPPPSAEE